MSIAQGCDGCADRSHSMRGDTATVQKHLACLDDDTKMLYRILGKHLAVIAQEKKSPTMITMRYGSYYPSNHNQFYAKNMTSLIL